jgi:cysteine desulfuration protein SufE
MTDTREIQDEIIDEFSILGDDKESTIEYLMEIGNKLPPFPENERTDENIIKGCQSKVWLTTKFENNRVIYLADSNTDITKGLISLLIRVLSHRTPKEILDTELYFIDRIGMSGIIGSQRSNGLASMIKQMKLFALAYQQSQLNV